MLSGSLKFKIFVRFVGTTNLFTNLTYVDDFGKVLRATSMGSCIRGDPIFSTYYIAKKLNMFFSLLPRSKGGFLPLARDRTICGCGLDPPRGLHFTEHPPPKELVLVSKWGYCGPLGTAQWPEPVAIELKIPNAGVFRAFIYDCSLAPSNPNGHISDVKCEADILCVPPSHSLFRPRSRGSLLQPELSRAAPHNLQNQACSPVPVEPYQRRWRAYYA